jgi:hypothetical protein
MATVSSVVKSAYTVHTHSVQHFSQKQPLGNQTSMSTYTSLLMRAAAASINKNLAASTLASSMNWFHLFLSASSSPGELEN